MQLKEHKIIWPNIAIFQENLFYTIVFPIYVQKIRKDRVGENRNLIDKAQKCVNSEYMTWLA
jgi:hypothetical protein